MNELVGASDWEQGLYDHLSSHEEQERELLVDYQQAAITSKSAAFSYLVDLIVDDEIRHHRTFRDLASTLKAEAELRPDEPVLPRLDLAKSDPRLILELTERLLDSERTDAKELHRLAGEMKDVKDTTIWWLLVRLMEMDSAKHIEILDFVRRHAHNP